EHRLSVLKLLAAVARLASPIGSRVSIGLRVRDASALRFLGGFRLSLCGCRHEGDQRISDCALHRVLSGTVERDAVDHRADDDTAPHELADPEKHKADKRIAKMKANNNGKMGGRNGGKPAIRPRARSLRPLAP